MTINIDLFKYIVQFDTDNETIINQIESLFKSRSFRVVGDSSNGKIELHCQITESTEQFEKIREQYSFNSPEIHVSPGITIRYALSAKDTAFLVSHTAVIVISAENERQSCVYIHPHVEKKPEDKEKRYKPEAESFIYPLLVEWLKKFGSCLMHCGAVVINDRAVIFSGPPGSGKSTLVMRMMLQGYPFLADDLAILTHIDGDIVMLPFREIANVNEHSMETFPELEFLNDSPLRGDKKYSIDISNKFQTESAKFAYPGLFIHLFPDDEKWIRKTDDEHIFDNIHSMAWFQGKPEDSPNHFWLLSEWLEKSIHIDVSRGYLFDSMQPFIKKLNDFLMCR